MSIAELSEVLAYRNEAVVLRFMETWEMPREEAQDIFEQTKKWLWLCARCKALPNPPPMAISPSLKLVDEMWHTFILFTQDYQHFSDRVLRYFVHHTPTSRATYHEQIAQYERDRAAHMQKLEEQYGRLYEVVHDELGPETLVKWYSEYTDRYTDAHLRQIWRWAFSPYDTRTRRQVRLASEGA